MENAAERRQSKKPGKDIPGNSPCHGRAVGWRHTGGFTMREIEVHEFKKVPRNCSTCLYGGALAAGMRM